MAFYISPHVSSGMHQPSRIKLDDFAKEMKELFGIFDSTTGHASYVYHESWLFNPKGLYTVELYNYL